MLQLFRNHPETPDIGDRRAERVNKDPSRRRKDENGIEISPIEVHGEAGVRGRLRAETARKVA